MSTLEQTVIYCGESWIVGGIWLKNGERSYFLHQKNKNDVALVPATILENGGCDYEN